MDLIERLKDLYEQAIKERSHYYVGSLIKEVIDILEKAPKSKVMTDWEKKTNMELRSIVDCPYPDCSACEIERSKILNMIKREIVEVVGEIKMHGNIQDPKWAEYWRTKEQALEKRGI